MLVDGSAVTDIGPMHVWRISGAPDAMRWISAGEIHVATYMWGAGKRRGMLTPYCGYWSWRGKLRAWQTRWRGGFLEMWADQGVQQ